MSGDREDEAGRGVHDGRDEPAHRVEAAEQRDEVADVRDSTERHDGHAFEPEVSSAHPGQRLDGDLVARALDEHRGARCRLEPEVHAFTLI